MRPLRPARGRVRGKAARQGGKRGGAAGRCPTRASRVRALARRRRRFDAEAGSSSGSVATGRQRTGHLSHRVWAAQLVNQLIQEVGRQVQRQHALPQLPPQQQALGDVLRLQPRRGACARVTEFGKAPAGDDRVSGEGPGAGQPLHVCCRRGACRRGTEPQPSAPTPPSHPPPTRRAPRGSASRGSAAAAPASSTQSRRRAPARAPLRPPRPRLWTAARSRHTGPRAARPWPGGGRRRAGGGGGGGERD